MAEGRVLIVEDEGEVAEVLEYNLTRRGFRTSVASDGLTACRLIAQEKPDLILLDLMLPDLDGREVCRLLRGHRDERLASTPVLMLTALAAPADRVGGLSLGADDYVAKPFSVEEVVLRASRLVARRRAEEAKAADTAKWRDRESTLLELQDMLFHELRNQLVIVGGFSGRLFQHGDLLPQDKLRSYARAINRSATHLGSLAEEVLLLRRVECGELEMPLQAVVIGDLLRDVAETFAGHADERGASIRVDVAEGLPALQVNHPCARIVLSCLVENALKYGREGGPVRISCEPGPAGRLAIEVEDDGRGIPEDEIDRVFDKFYRGANARKTTKGTGLGLYFAKTLVEAMGGTIGALSTLGKGTRFRVELPS